MINLADPADAADAADQAAAEVVVRAPWGNRVAAFMLRLAACTVLASVAAVVIAGVGGRNGMSWPAVLVIATIAGFGLTFACLTVMAFVLPTHLVLRGDHLLLGGRWIRHRIAYRRVQVIDIWSQGKKPKSVCLDLGILRPRIHLDVLTAWRASMALRERCRTAAIWHAHGTLTLCADEEHHEQSVVAVRDLARRRALTSFAAGLVGAVAVVGTLIPLLLGNGRPGTVAGGVIAAFVCFITLRMGWEWWGVAREFDEAVRMERLWLLTDDEDEDDWDGDDEDEDDWDEDDGDAEATDHAHDHLVDDADALDDDAPEADPFSRA